jgi:hypothetical protein
MVVISMAEIMGYLLRADFEKSVSDLRMGRGTTLKSGQQKRGRKSSASLLFDLLMVKGV